MSAIVFFVYPLTRLLTSVVLPTCPTVCHQHLDPPTSKRQTHSRRSHNGDDDGWGVSFNLLPTLSRRPTERPVHEWHMQPRLILLYIPPRLLFCPPTRSGCERLRYPTTVSSVPTRAALRKPQGAPRRGWDSPLGSVHGRAASSTCPSCQPCCPTWVLCASDSTASPRPSRLNVVVVGGRATKKHSTQFCCERFDV